MRTLKYQKGQWEIIAAAGLNMAGGMMSNTSNANINRATMNFNKNQANADRNFNRNQAAVGREFATGEGVKSREFNSSEALLNRQWQEKMSNTSHQREMQDLAKAGINPLLTARLGGSSSPSGGQASSNNVNAANASHSTQGSPGQIPRKNIISPSVASALATRRLLADVKQAEADALKKTEEATTQGSVRASIKMQINLMMAQISNVDADTSNKQIAHRQTTLNNIILETITTPQGKLDIEKAKLTLEELQMEIDVLRGPRGKLYKELEVASKGSTAGGIVAGTTAALSIAGVGKLKGIYKAIQNAIKTKSAKAIFESTPFK